MIRKRIIQLSLALFLLALPVILYIRCDGVSQRLHVQSYRQAEKGKYILLVIQGQYFGDLGETEVLINGRVLAPGSFFKWNDNEIQLFIRKPFTYAQIQLKREKQSSLLIPVWNPEYLPKIQHTAQVQGFPVLESFQMLSSQPPILEIQGQNLGFRYDGQLLLFSRRHNSSIYFEPSQFENFRPLQEAELLFWSNQTIRMLLPQDTVGGPLFLLRYNEAGKLLASNSLYLPNDNRNAALPASSSASQSPEQILRLVLQHSPNIILDPQLLSETKLAINQEPSADSQAPDYSPLFTALQQHRKQQKSSARQNSAGQEALTEVSLSWPRNQIGQSWLNLAPKAVFASSLISPSPADKPRQSNRSSGFEKNLKGGTSANSNKLLLLPVRSIQVSSIPENIAQQFPLLKFSYVFRPSSSTIAVPPTMQTAQQFPPQSLYLLLRLATGSQEVPAGIRKQNYSKAELAQLRYIFQNNSVIILQYRVPHWQGSDIIAGNSQISPYWKAMELYKQAVREWRVRSFNPEEALSSAIWLRKDRKLNVEAVSANLRNWPTNVLAKQTTLQSNDSQTTVLRAEQILLLLLRAFSQMNIPVRIIAGAAANFPTSSLGLNKATSSSPLEPYYWLEIYLPNYGWFPLDPIAEITQYQQNPNNLLRYTNFSPQFWGSLYAGQESSSVANPANLSKLAFFALEQEWQSFDEDLHASQNHSYQLSWNLQRLR